jgi:hypothetical protein
MIGSVFVRNPAGTKVALWEEVALDEGKKLHQSIPTDKFSHLTV